MAQPTSFMHQHVYVSQFPAISSLSVLRKHEYGYLLKRVSLVSDLMFFLLRKGWSFKFKSAWRAEYRMLGHYRKAAMSLRDKYKTLLSRPYNIDYTSRKPPRVLTTITLYLKWLRCAFMHKEWYRQKRRYRYAKSIKFLHIEAFRTLCYRSYFYVYIYALRYR